MKKLLKALWREDKAENMPEYALLLFLISLTAVSAVGGVANRVNKIWFTASVRMTTASNAALVGGPAAYTVEAPAGPTSNPNEVNQEIRH